MQRLLKLILDYKFHFLVFALSLLILTRFYIDADLGWHIAYGRAFLEGKWIIRSDPFSWTMAGHFWANSYFLYQIVLAWLFGNLGYLTTVFLFGVLASVSAVLLLPRKLTILAVAVAAIGLLTARVNLGIKPHVFDFLFFAILLLLMERKTYKRLKLAPLWFLFFAFWANFHAGFLIGLLTFSGFVILDYIKRKKFSAGLVLLLGAAFLGTLATPFSIQIWKAIFFDSTSPLGLLYVYEWQPVIFSLKLMLPYALSSLIFLYIFRNYSRKIEPEWLLLGAVLFMLPFLSSFYLFFWGEYFIFFASRHVNFKGSRLDLLAVFVLTVIIFGSLFNFGKQLVRSKTIEARFKADGYPVSAMNFIVARGYTDRLFNYFNWGGFIDWQYPGVPVFIDGRMNGWRRDDGGYIFDDFIGIVRGECDSFSRYEPKIALLTKSSSEKCFSGWVTVYSDSISKVLVK